MSLDTEGFGGYKEINFEEERSRRGTVWSTFIVG
jgi:hypothetical protein